MRSLLFALALVAPALILPGCSSAAEGTTCENPTVFDCRDDTSALECKAGLWTAVPCKGPKGCASSGGDVLCDLSGNAAGDACPAVHEGKGQCAPDGRATLECRGGTFQQTNTCGSCSVQQQQVVCR